MEARTWSDRLLIFLAIFSLPDLLGPKRTPIGLKEIIQTVNANTIRGFHDRWYRLENSIVVAVGDLPRDELKARITATFASWRNDTPAPKKPDLGHIDPARPTAALIETEDRAPPTLRVCRGKSDCVTSPVTKILEP